MSIMPFSILLLTHSILSFPFLLPIPCSGPPISVEISGSEATPTAGQIYTLICIVSGAENLNPTTTYWWTKSNTNVTQTQVGTNSNTLSFSSLRLSDAGKYTCAVAVTSDYLARNVILTSSYSENVSIQSEKSSLEDRLLNYEL